MEFLKRKHFSLWIIIILFAVCIQVAVGLQGVPTWICLGIKSPFIEFRADIEILANTSISLNLTKDEQALMHQEGLQKLGTFIKPIDLRNSTTGFVKANLTKKIPTTPPGLRRKGHTENPIAEEMDQKEIELLEEDPNDADQGFAGLTDEDRKFIVPMALKNPSTVEPKRIIITTTTTTTTTTTPSPPLAQQSKSDITANIQDLKNHILMLQNLTKNDKTFQSKFVVFPSIQRERNITQSITPQRSYHAPIITPPTIPLTRRPPIYERPQYLPDSTRQRPLLYEDNDDDHHHDTNFFAKEKITIIPQVLLLNDQTPPDDDDEDYEAERRRADERRERISTRRRNFRKSTSTTTTTTTTSTTTTTQKPFRRNNGGGGGGGGGQKRQRNGERRNKKRQQNCKNLDTPKCQRQKRRQQLQEQKQQQQQEQLSLNVNKTNTASIASTSFSLLAESPVNIGIENNQSFDSIWNNNKNNNNNNNADGGDMKLSRSIRSHHSRRNAGSGGYKDTVGSISSSSSNGFGMMINGGSPSYYDGVSNRDFIIPIGNSNNGNVFNQSAQPYKEIVDLNPELCYKVDGMTYGQQKLCVIHTSIMPAISRGARSAIQECQHQFKNRRWNCSTVEDNTVFGPMSSLGSPEMAFIHALAAATVTSFIARACRDGQLASCGCSRSARPKQLHDDWTWGGCGDDLEFAYKFAQEFIDIREKERKRGIRGLVSVPPKHKLEESDGLNSTLILQILPNGTQITTTTEHLNKSDNQQSPYKSEDLIELQEKITKEILNSKLQEKEMMELQEKINREIMNSKVFNLEHHVKKHQRNGGGIGSSSFGRFKNGMSAKARSLMNLHNNEAGRRAVIKKTRITCKCHGVSGSCSMITCWQQLSSIREIGDYLREKYDAATEVKLNKRGRLQVKDPRYKVPTAHDLVYLDESPDWCRNNKQLQWPGTHGRVCNKTSSGLDGCGILCCGRGYNTKNIVVRERCNCKFHWCCQVKCEICVKILEEHTCK